MSIPFVKLSYRQLIDRTATGDFEKKVFNDSYRELLLQVQRYNKDNQFTRFVDILANDPRAQSLHYKVGFAIGLYVKELNGLIPGLWDAQQQAGIPFTEHRLEIVASDITDKRQHVVAIIYTTPPLAFPGTVGNYLILGFDRPLQPADEWLDTMMLPMQPGLTVSAYCASVLV